jgi:hypothetical protein
MTEIWDPAISEDLEKFVLFMYPWGKANTPLANFSGPRTWQRDELQKITEYIKVEKERMSIGLEPEMYQSATCSGRGPGKSALVSWLNHWAMSCQIGGTCINTANTEPQLKTKTWAEVGKWHTLALNSHWFDKSALSVKPAEWFETLIKDQLKIDTGYYYSSALLWSADNPDAFAGAHNPLGMMLIFDEASGIPENIWTVSEGFFTEPTLHRYWFVFSNPRRNTGAFYECFHKHRNFWRRRSIDSRTVEGTDKNHLNRIIEKYGEDSDEARVEVKGQFPRQGDAQFISREVIDLSMERELEQDGYAPLILGIDVARFGNDKTVFRWRQGRDARSIPPVEIKSADNMVVANTAAEWIDKTDPDAVCIDVGAGTGVIDRLRERGYKVHEVQFGGASTREEWQNFRTELWDRMREWLRGGMLDHCTELVDDLAGPKYKFVGVTDKIRLETKEEMKSRGLASPDHGDALACTFAVRVARRDLRAARQNPSRVRVASDVDYNVFG